MDVLIDASNVRRSRWPNLTPEDILAACCSWAEAAGRIAHVVFDGPAPEPQQEDQAPVCHAVPSIGESADDVIARIASSWAEAGRPYELVTSDRELRQRAGSGATRVVGGGTFLRELGVER